MKWVSLDQVEESQEGVDHSNSSEDLDAKENVTNELGDLDELFQIHFE